jgi:hypothetical protein
MIDFNTKFGRAARKLLNREYFIWLTTVDPPERHNPGRCGLSGKTIPS